MFNLQRALIQMIELPSAHQALTAGHWLIHLAEKLIPYARNFTCRIDQSPTHNQVPRVLGLFQQKGVFIQRTPGFRKFSHTSQDQENDMP